MTPRLPPPPQGDDGSSAAAGSAASPPQSFNGSALEWVLRKADESLDEIEENPPEYAKVIYDISTGPSGAFERPDATIGCSGLLACTAGRSTLQRRCGCGGDSAVHAAELQLPAEVLSCCWMKVSFAVAVTHRTTAAGRDHHSVLPCLAHQSLPWRRKPPTSRTAPVPCLFRAGKAASTTVTTAAKVTVEVGTEALKAAAPVGKWALKQGFKLAVGAVSKGLASAADSRKKDSNSKKKGGK